MKAARLFLKNAVEGQHFDAASSVMVELYGSLALTGVGHGTDKAIIMGLEGETPEEVYTESVDLRFHQICRDEKINFRLTELSPLFLFANIVLNSSILKLFECITTRISESTINPPPIFPHSFTTFSAALFE